MTERLDELTAFGRAHKCARLRGSAARYALRGRFRGGEKHGHSDLVTEHDRWAQRFLTGGI